MLQYGGSGEARGLVGWIFIAGNGSQEKVLQYSTEWELSGKPDAGKGLALLRRFTFLAGHGSQLGAWANKGRSASAGKPGILPLRE